ncbi:NAD(P)-dependent oxidoreductase [Spirillospora sp. NPDC127200]
MTEKTPVTVLGLGLMGSVLAGTFARAGHPTTVWNRSDAKATPAGTARAATVREALEASPLVVVCLSVYDNVTEVLEAEGEALAGRAVVNLTNGTPSQARAMAETVRGLGADYLDGGIMAVPPMIGKPGALILYSGPEHVFAAHRDALGVLAEARYMGADAGLASLYDLALLAAMYGMFTGYYQAVALVRSEKVSAVEFTPMVESWVSAMMRSLPVHARAIDSGDHHTEVSNLANNEAGFPNLMRAAREQGVDTSLMEPLDALLKRAVAAGYGKDGVARLVDLLVER